MIPWNWEQGFGPVFIYLHLDIFQFCSLVFSQFWNTNFRGSKDEKEAKILGRFGEDYVHH